MTAAIFERIRDEDMIHVCDIGVIIYDSRLCAMLDADVLEQVLTIAGDNIVIDPGMDADSGAEVIEWGGVEKDCREAGLL